MSSAGDETARLHDYRTTVTWTGNRGDGTHTYRGYDRAYETVADGRPVLQGSSDPSFRGDPGKWNPELLLLSAVSQCHMLWFLHLASTTGIVVTDYVDEASATLTDGADGDGRFVEFLLRPVVTVSAESMFDAAQRLHSVASAHCFIANSLNVPVGHAPEVRLQPADGVEPSR